MNAKVGPYAVVGHSPWLSSWYEGMGFLKNGMMTVNMGWKEISRYIFEAMKQ